MQGKYDAGSLVRAINDYPKPGIVFRDITPVLQNAAAFSSLIDEFAAKLEGTDFDCIAGIEARGFIIGSALAYRMGKGFVPIRKKGKLPYKTIHRDYDLEYGKSSIEIHTDSIKKGEGVVIVDDLLATGGTAKAAAELVEEAGGSVKCIAFFIELSFLKGREKLGRRKIISLVKY